MKMNCVKSLGEFEMLEKLVPLVRLTLNFANFTRQHHLHSQQQHPFDFFTGSMQLLDIVRVTLYAALIVAALVGNLLVIAVVVSCGSGAGLNGQRARRSAAKYFILNLAVCDLAMVVSCVWVKLVVGMHGDHWVIGSFFCKLDSYMQMVSIVASVMTLMAIACDRYLGVMHPLRVRLTERQSVCCLTLIWLVALVVAAPSFAYRQYTERRWADFVERQCDDFGWPIVFVKDEQGCLSVTRPAKRVYYTTVIVGTYVLPVVVMGVTYSLMIAKLWRAELVGELATIDKQLVIAKRKKVIVMLVWILVLFVVCWSPLEFMLLYMEYTNAYPWWWPHAEWLVYLIAYSNTAINPFVYAGMSDNYRHGLRRLRHSACRFLLCYGCCCCADLGLSSVSSSAATSHFNLSVAASQINTSRIYNRPSHFSLRAVSLSQSYRLSTSVTQSIVDSHDKSTSIHLFSDKTHSNEHP